MFAQGLHRRAFVVLGECVEKLHVFDGEDGFTKAQGED